MTFFPARLNAQSVPRTLEKPVAAGEEFEKGALGSLVADEFTEAAADPAVGAVTFVAANAFGANATGFGAIAGNREFPPGRMVIYDAFASPFRCEWEGTYPAALGGSYGVVRSADGSWRVNFDDVVAPLQVRHIGPPLDDLPDEPLLVEVEFIPA